MVVGRAREDFVIYVLDVPLEDIVMGKVEVTKTQALHGNHSHSGLREGKMPRNQPGVRRKNKNRPITAPAGSAMTIQRKKSNRRPASYPRFQLSAPYPGSWFHRTRLTLESVRKPHPRKLASCEAQRIVA